MKKTEGFNGDDVTIVENRCGFKPNVLGSNSLTDKEEIRTIFKFYKNHPSVRQVKNAL